MGGKNSYESIKRYQDKAYDQMLIRVPKGRKAEIKSCADSQGKSVNAFVVEAIDEKIDREEGKGAGGGA